MARCAFQKRQQTSKETCSIPREPIRPYYYFVGKVAKYFNILVDDKHKMLFCSIPKAGCTSWKNYLVLMSDRVKLSRDIGGKVHIRSILKKYGLTYLSEYKAEARKKRLAAYKKFVVVRHPFARLYSAYMNKYYDSVYSWKISQNIIRKYGPKDRSSADVNMIKKHTIFPTFEEFSKFVVGEYGKNFREAHWTKYQDLCYPCEIKYDHILKLETIGTDTEEFLKLPYMSDGKSIKLPKYNPSSGSKESHKLQEMFGQLPVKVVKDLYKLYEEDFKMFGYTWDFTSSKPGCNSTEDECC